MKKALRAVIVCCGAPLIVYFGAATFVDLKNEHRRRYVGASLASSLKPGATSDQIERSLAAAGLGFTFDKLFSRYEASLRTSDFWKCGVWVTVDVDAAKRMKKLQVQAYYTGP